MPTEAEQVKQLGLMLPERIEVEPFTKIKSFDEDAVPDGILAVVRPVDPFDDPVKAAGLFYFELYARRQASSEPRGERLQFWQVNIDSADDVREYWSRAQMYEFPLVWTGGTGQIQPRRQYLLVVTYRTPWDTTLRAEHEIEFHPPGEFLSEPTRTAPSP